MTTSVLAPISVGELIDKITILELKKTKTNDLGRLKNILVELGQLLRILDTIVVPPEIDELRTKLFKVNSELWDIEDSKRQCEKTQIFDSAFIQLARNVYLKNDLRASIKKQINQLTNSSIIEEKIY
jgi:hypothetical protein